jgi:hypothetical protein
VKVKELIEKLQKCNPEADVFVDQDWTSSPVEALVILSEYRVEIPWGIDRYPRDMLV